MIDEPAGDPDEQAPEADDRPSVARRMVSGAGEVVAGAGEAIASAGEAIAGAGEVIADALRPAAERVRDVAADLVEDLAEAREVRRSKARRRRQRTLPNLFDIHPDARGAAVQEVGLIAVPVDEILGSAVDGPAQRGPDFLPLKPLRSLNWEARWQRIRKAIDKLQVLPPIEVLQTPDGYWVVDGHNRVAAAKATGQVAIDAAVRAVRLPGKPLPRSRAELAPLLEGSGELRAAGQGLLTPGAAREARHRDHTRPASTGRAEADAADGE